MIDLTTVKKDDLVAQQEALDEHNEKEKPKRGFEKLFYKKQEVVSDPNKKESKGIVGAVKKIFTRKNKKNSK